MQNLIKQTDSKNSFIREGFDWNGNKFSKKLITLCLEFETFIKNDSNYVIEDNWSDYQPGYMIYGVRENPNENELDFSKNYYPILEVFPRVIGEGVYYIRDNRKNSPYRGKLFSDKSFSLVELVEELKNKNRGSCITDKQMN